MSPKYYTVFHMEKSRLGLPTGGYLGFAGTPEARALVPQELLPPLHIFWRLAKPVIVGGKPRLVILEGDVDKLPPEYGPPAPAPAPPPPPPPPPSPEMVEAGQEFLSSIVPPVETPLAEAGEVPGTYQPTPVEPVQEVVAPAPAPKNELDEVMGSLDVGGEEEKQPQQDRKGRGKRR